MQAVRVLQMSTKSMTLINRSNGGRGYDRQRGIRWSRDSSLLVFYTYQATWGPTVSMTAQATACLSSQNRDFAGRQ